LCQPSLSCPLSIATITALILLIPSVGFMLVVERFLEAATLAEVRR
jgi:putative spermidine/putrescine transport system permease protein